MKLFMEYKPIIISFPFSLHDLTNLAFQDNGNEFLLKSSWNMLREFKYYLLEFFHCLQKGVIFTGDMSLTNNEKKLTDFHLNIKLKLYLTE